MQFFINSNKMLFFFILFFSTMISISSNSWLGCWLGLEINLLSFITIISNSKNLLTSEASLKYFLIQSISSINFLFFILFNMNFLMIFNMNFLLNILINSTLLMKMGSVPFHFWFPNIMEGLSWLNSFILMTWQKITPMILLSYYYNYNFLILISIMTAIISTISGLNQSSLRKLLTFSSINHISWMIMAMMISSNLWTFYFFIYFFLIFVIYTIFLFFNSSQLNQLFSLNFKNSIKLMIFLNILSLMGFPPLLGFLPKWIIINFLMMKNSFFTIFILIMTSLITFIFYIRIMYSSFMFNYFNLKMFKIFIKNKLMNSFNFFYFISLFSLLISTLLFYPI